ncbi:acyl-CoA dehydrogenase family protein [Phytohabitans sp. LJ34]|uniref:acyl-CoA dehydrogenase family protein n=1 Tax=Phytohabitans sp. LJ34 TaxID=3452217 RepID=UPI003F8988AB
MLDTSVDFVPTTDPARMLDDPAAARAILRQVLAYLDERAADLDPAAQLDLARRVGLRSGLYAAQFPVEYGGWDMTETLAAELREEAAATGTGYSRVILSSHEGPSRMLLSATPEQRERWLRPLVDGRLTRCLAMTEERGGSDLTRVASSATWSGGKWVLTGRKFLISNAAQADVAIVLVRAVGARVEGPTFFVFGTDTPGWRVVRALPGMDPLYTQYEVELDAIELPEDAVVGGPERVGGAAGVASEWLPFGRICLAARAVGLARWALNVARRHADQRVVFGVRLSEKQYIREFIVRSDIKVEASRALLRKAAAALDAGHLAVREAAMAKLCATEAACEVIDDAMQVLGGRGWLVEYGLERAYREARLLRIVDGTSEMLKETVFHMPPHTGERSY